MRKVGKSLFNTIIRLRFNDNATKRFQHKMTFVPDLEYLCSYENQEIIEKNLKFRKSQANYQNLQKTFNEFQKLKEASSNDTDTLNKLQSDVIYEASLFPNKTHPDALKESEEPTLLKLVGEKKESNFHHYKLSELALRWDLLRTQHVGLISGTRTYYLKKDLAKMEFALIRYTMDFLKKRGFLPISVPDIVNIDILKNCGIPHYHIDHQVYKLRPEWSPEENKQWCLSGTAEMALVGHLASHTLSKDSLPLRLAAFSRCFRQEEAEGKEGQNLFRVKQFYKVEMVMACKEESSDSMFDELVDIQTELFGSLGIHFQVLDMPASDFNHAAYRKVDIEAWMPGMEAYGEISSASNCTDYQSRRLQIRYNPGEGEPTFVHTLNGTACAVPRMLIAICETHQNENHTITIPEVLRPFMDGQKTIPLNKKHVERNQWILAKYI